MTTTRRSVTIGLLALAVGSGGCRHAEPAAEASSATWESGTLIVPPGSPMLAQIRREPVTVAELATDEVIAPGKVEANPNRVSKIVAPVPGRIASVIAWAIDAMASRATSPARMNGTVEIRSTLRIAPAICGNTG